MIIKPDRDTRYLVRWECEVDATTPVEAVMRAMAQQQAGSPFMAYRIKGLGFPRWYPVTVYDNGRSMRLGRARRRIRIPPT